MIALDIPAPRLVHLRRHWGRLERRTEGTDHRAPALDLLDIRDLELPPLPLHPSRIADLATRLRVERILLELQLQGVARLAEGEEIGVGARRVVADPLLPGLRLPRATPPRAAAARRARPCCAPAPPASGCAASPARARSPPRPPSAGARRR